MSKWILIDEEELRTVIKALDFGIVSLLRENKSADYSPLIHAEGLLKSSIVASKKRYLEWHPMSEKPEKGRIILVRHKDNSVPFDVYKVGALILDGFDYQYANVKEWAYLPE